MKCIPISRVVLTGVLASAVLLSSTLLAAQEVQLSGRPKGPFAGYVFRKSWMQKTAVVANRSDQPRKIKIACTAQTSAGAKVIYSRVVEVPAQSLREVTFAYKPEELQTRKTRIQGLNQAEITYSLWDLTAGRQLTPISYSESLVEKGPLNVGILAKVGDDPESMHGGHAFLSNLSDRQLGTDVAVLPYLLSRFRKPADHWYGYDGLDLLIMRRMDADSLSPVHVQAILDWVRRGNTLLITSSEAMPELLAGELGQAAGVIALGTHRRTSVQAVSPADRFDLYRTERNELPLVELPWPALMTELHATTADVIYEAQGLPLLTRRVCGAGRIMVLALPLGATKPSKLHPIYDSIYRASMVHPPIRSEAFLTSQAAPVTLEEIAGRKATGRSIPAGTLLALVAIIVGTGLLLRRSRRGEWLWLVLIPLTVLMSIGVYVWSISRSEPQRITYVGLILCDGSEMRVQELFAYYTGPQELTGAVLSSDSPRGIIEDQRESALGALTSSEVRTARTILLPDVSIPSRTSRAVLLDSVLPGQAASGTLTFGSDGLTGVLENQFPAEIAQTVIYTGFRTYALGSLGVGRPTEISVGPDDVLSQVEFIRPMASNVGGRFAQDQDLTPYTKGEFTPSLTHTAEDRRRNRLLGRLVSVPGQRLRIEKRPIAIGYVQHSPLMPISDRQMTRQGWCVIAWPLEIEPPRPGTSVLIPSGFTNTTFDSAGTQVYNRVNASFLSDVRYSGTLIVRSRVPQGMDPLERPEVTLDVDMRAMNFRLSVYGIPAGQKDHKGRLVLLEERDNLMGTATIGVPEPERFRQPDGTYRFVLQVDPTGQSSAKGLTGAVVPKWSFRQVDVTLRGTAR